MIKEGEYKKWRTRLLTQNTLISAITFPVDLFCPINVHTAGIIIKKGIPHPKNQPVLWIRALNDGFTTKKAKRLENPKVKNDLLFIKDLLKTFVKNQMVNVDNKPEFYKSEKIDYDDLSLELIPEAYLDQHTLTQDEIEKGIDELVRETASFILRSKREGDFIENQPIV
jgi:type I restriction-modification system DNA methylase subunit